MWSRLIFPLFRKNDNFYSATCTHPFYQWIWFGSRWWRVVIFCKVRAIVKQVLLLHVSQKQKHAHQDHIIIITILYLRWKQNIATFQRQWRRISVRYFICVGNCENVHLAWWNIKNTFGRVAKFSYSAV